MKPHEQKKKEQNKSEKGKNKGRYKNQIKKGEKTIKR
jgi:hypothetical protein